MSSKITKRVKKIDAKSEAKIEAKSEPKIETNPFEGFAKALNEAARCAAEIQKQLKSEKVLEGVAEYLNVVFEKNKKIVAQDVSDAFTSVNKHVEEMKGIKTKQPAKPKAKKDEATFADRVAKGIDQTTKKNLESGEMGNHFYNVNSGRIVIGNSKTAKTKMFYVQDPPVCGIDSDEFKMVIATYHIKQEQFDLAMKHVKLVEFVKKAYEGTNGTKAWYNLASKRLIHGKVSPKLQTVEIVVLGLNLRIAYDVKGMEEAKNLGVDLGLDSSNVCDSDAESVHSKSVHSKSVAKSAAPLFSEEE